MMDTVSVGPVCIVYNLPNLNPLLKLRGKSLSGILPRSYHQLAGSCDYQGQSGLGGAQSRSYRRSQSDGSGTTKIFTSYGLCCPAL